MVDKADDAIALWQQMIGEMQKGFRAFGSQLPRGSAGHVSDQEAAAPNNAQNQLAQFMESYFAGMNMPSRAQLNAMSDRLQAIEGELTDIKGLLHEALMNSKPVQDLSPPVRPGPKRPTTGKPQRRQSGPAEKVTLVPGNDK